MLVMHNLLYHYLKETQFHSLAAKVLVTAGSTDLGLANTSEIIMVFSMYWMNLITWIASTFLQNMSL